MYALIGVLLTTAVILYIWRKKRRYDRSGSSSQVRRASFSVAIGEATLDSFLLIIASVLTIACMVIALEFGGGPERYVIVFLLIDLLYVGWRFR